MLMTQKAYLSALRRLVLFTTVQIDLSTLSTLSTISNLSTCSADEAVRVRAAEIVGLLTPISKAFGTDLGVELTALAVQVRGGMGTPKRRVRPSISAICESRRSTRIRTASRPPTSWVANSTCAAAHASSSSTR